MSALNNRLQKLEQTASPNTGQCHCQNVVIDINEEGKARVCQNCKKPVVNRATGTQIIVDLGELSPI